MGAQTGIPWTGATWTPIRARNKATGAVGWFCIHKSPGCTNCYAESINLRLGTRLPFREKHRADVEIFLDETMLLAPLRWQKPRQIFVCSMTDLFADFVKDEWIDRLFAVMAQTPRHTYQILTKRPERMRWYGAAMAGLTPRDRSLRIIESMYRGHPAEHLVSGLDATKDRVGPFPWPPSNVWAGVSVENHSEAFRLDVLRETPAAVRWVSFEPLLGPLGEINLAGIDWAVWGGESGTKARPCDAMWIREGVRQCREQNTVPYVKQYGKRAWDSDRAPGGWCAETKIRTGDPKGEHIENGPEDLRGVREFPR